MALARYCAQAITNAATNNGIVATQRGLSFMRVLFLAAIDAAVCTMYDLGVDPVMVHNGCVHVFLFVPACCCRVRCGVVHDSPFCVHHGTWRCRYWTWRGAPETLVFFGVPIQNFVGWFVTGFVISACVRLMLGETLGPANTRVPAGRSRCGSAFFAAVPVLYYFGEALYSAAGAVSPFDKQMPSEQRQSLGLVVAFTAVTWSVFALGQMATAAPDHSRKSHKH